MQMKTVSILGQNDSVTETEMFIEKLFPMEIKFTDIAEIDKH